MKLTILRGKPSAGKTTMAPKLAEIVIEEDDYIIQPFTKINAIKAVSAIGVRLESAMQTKKDIVLVGCYPQRESLTRFDYLVEKYGYRKEVSTIPCNLTVEEMVARNANGVDAAQVRRILEMWED